MKGKQLCGLALASLLVLSGCSSSVKEDGKYVVASIDDKNILADDIYSSLSSSTSGPSILFDYVLQQLIQEKFPINDDMKENAAQIVENIEANYKNQYGDDSYEKQLESALASSGYEDMDAYEQSLIQSLQYSEFIKKYVKDHFDEVFEDYYKQESPRIMSLIKVSMSDVDNPTTEEKENLEEVKKLLKTDKSFADIASSYSDDDSKSAKGNIGVIDSTSSLASLYGDDVEEKALSLKEGKVSDAIKGTDGYYFLYCTSTDKDTIKKELKTIDIDSPLLVYDNYIVYLAFNSYKCTYKDDEMKKQIEKVVNDALKSREEERGQS